MAQNDKDLGNTNGAQLGAPWMDVCPSLFSMFEEKLSVSGARVCSDKG